MKLINDDCLIAMKKMDSNSVDSIVTDPPAGIGFMGKDWDKNKGGRDQWIAWLSEIMTEALRVLKPGGHALVWSLPRTSHWTGFALENAGFEVRDCVYHLFGTGFPKSLDISKAIDAMHGAEREVVGINDHWNRKNRSYQTNANIFSQDRLHGQSENLITAPATEDAQKWSGWGTALKPAVEQWWLVRKPLSEKTIANNVLKWGTGGLNIDECRVPTDDDTTRVQTNDTPKFNEKYNYFGNPLGFQNAGHELGRFPANLTHDGSDEVVSLFPHTKSGKHQTVEDINRNNWSVDFNKGLSKRIYNGVALQESEGSASRFFYCAKASKSDRNEGCEDLEEKQYSCDGRNKEIENAFQRNKSVSNNHHPTVKSTKLMRYFCKLITPPKGIILDPFMGSGSTGKAAVIEGFDFIGIELDAEYFEIAKRRIESQVTKSKNQVELLV